MAVSCRKTRNDRMNGVEDQVTKNRIATRPPPRRHTEYNIRTNIKTKGTTMK